MKEKDTNRKKNASTIAVNDILNVLKQRRLELTLIINSLYFNVRNKYENTIKSHKKPMQIYDFLYFTFSYFLVFYFVYPEY
jgi:hypothetical protein